MTQYTSRWEYTIHSFDVISPSPSLLSLIALTRLSTEVVVQAKVDLIDTDG